jgi:hypothetical protein
MTLSAEERNIGEVYQTAPLFTNVNQYVEPLRLSMEWWDLKHLERKHSFSSWNPKGIGIADYLPIIEAQVSPPGVSDAGSFYFRVWDTEKVVDPLTLRRKGIVVMKARKYESDPDLNMMYGFIQKVRQQREGTQLYYVVSGIGSGVLLNERYVNLNRTAKMQSLESTTPIFNDETMQVRRLYKEILSNKDLYVVDDIPISKQVNPEMDMLPLDQSRVKASLLTINEPYVQISHALNVLLDSVGADGGIDANNKPYLEYPTSAISGIVLKSWDTVAESGFDKAANTAYFMDNWDWEIDWSKEAGFSNRLLAKSRVTSGSATDSTEGAYQGFFNLADVDLAQKIPASPARFTNISIIVSRRGVGTINPAIKTLHGHIHQDNNGVPGIKVANFDIPLSSIPEDTPTPKFLEGLKFVGPVDPSKEHWITLYERGNFEDNTINWYFTADATSTSVNARRPRVPGSPWTQNHESTSGWEVATNNTFHFAYSIFDNFTHIIIGEDVDSQQRYGIVEDLVDVSFATNTIAANKYLGELLAIRSLPKITYNTNKVTIPGNLFLPGVIVTVQDALTDLRIEDSMIAEVTSASYNFGAGGDNQLGCMFADINLVGHYDYKLVGSDIITIGDET